MNTLDDSLISSVFDLKVTPRKVIFLFLILLDKIKNCIKITGFVNSTDDFFDQPKVINPASETLSSIFGDKGKHARAAVSTNSLPLGAAVEIDAIFEI